MALTAEPLNNSQTYGDLLRRAYDGEDVRAEAKVARFIDKQIDNTSYTEIIKLSQANQEGIEDPVDQGRKFVIDSVGGLSENIGFADSAIIANAKRNYDESISRFREKENRLPTQSEALEIADEIIPRWQTIEQTQIRSLLPKPRFMTMDEKVKRNLLTKSRMEEIKSQTDEYFFNKYNGDIDQMMNDPEYLNEMDYIDSFETLVSSTTTQGSR